MKRNLKSLLAVAATLALAPVALADPPHFDRDHGYDHPGHYRGSRERGWDGRGRYDGNDRYRDRYGWRSPGGYGWPREYGGGRGYGWPQYGYVGRPWHRGDWLPPVYRARYYYVPDYRFYGPRLYAPPPGCRWVRDDRGGLLLLALATGIVVDAVYNPY